MELQNRKDISFITFTNYGYIHYTKNLIVSLEKYEPKQNKKETGDKEERCRWGEGEKGWGRY